jgi:hypothetical protein
MRLRTYGEYPSNWIDIANEIKNAAGWRCIRCKSPNDRDTGHVLTVHHWDGNKANCRWWNLLALCQKCHLIIQAKVNPDRPWVFVHSDWFQPYAAGFYAWTYLNQDIDRRQAVQRLGELLVLEAMTILGREPIAV